MERRRTKTARRTSSRGEEVMLDSSGRLWRLQERAVRGALRHRERDRGSSGSASLWATKDTLPASAVGAGKRPASNAIRVDDYGGGAGLRCVVVPAVCAVPKKPKPTGRGCSSRSRRLRPRRTRAEGWRLSRTQRQRLSFDGHVRHVRRGRGRGSYPRARCGEVHLGARHRRLVRGRHVGIPRRRRDDQALPSGARVRERRLRGDIR